MSFKYGEKTLLDDASATGEWVEWFGGRGQFICKFSGAGSVTLEFQLPDGLTSCAVGSDTTLTTSPSHGGFELPRCQIRAAVSGPTGVTAWVRETTVD